jgi:hypothetical protein
VGSTAPLKTLISEVGSFCSILPLESSCFSLLFSPEQLIQYLRAANPTNGPLDNGDDAQNGEEQEEEEEDEEEVTAEDSADALQAAHTQVMAERFHSMDISNGQPNRYPATHQTGPNPFLASRNQPQGYSTHAASGYSQFPSAAGYAYGYAQRATTPHPSLLQYNGYNGTHQAMYAGMFPSAMRAA